MPSAVSQRQRRKTAGTRLTELVGKAQDDDDAVWGHDTWGDEDGSGNESFHESDEDSAAKKDTFDSDFDISESDHDEEEAAAGEEEERELHRVERSNKQKKSHYVDVAKGGRALMQKQKGKNIRCLGKLGEYMMLLKQACPVAVCRRFLYNVSHCLRNSKKTKYKFLRVSYKVSDTVAVARLLYFPNFGQQIYQ